MPKRKAPTRTRTQQPEEPETKTSQLPTLDSSIFTDNSKFENS